MFGYLPIHSFIPDLRGLIAVHRGNQLIVLRLGNRVRFALRQQMSRVTLRTSSNLGFLDFYFNGEMFSQDVPTLSDDANLGDSQIRAAP